MKSRVAVKRKLPNIAYSKSRPDLTVAGFAEVSVRSSSSYELFLPDALAVFKRLHWRPATTHLALMCSLIIVVIQPGVQILLQLLQAGVELFPEGYLVKLLQNRLVKSFADSVGLRGSGLGFGVIDIIDGQIKLIVMTFNFAAIFSASVCQDSQHRQFLLYEERKNLVVKQVGGRNRRLGAIKLRKSHLDVGVNQSLLVDPTDAFHWAHVKGIL